MWGSLQGTWAEMRPSSIHVGPLCSVVGLEGIEDGVVDLALLGPGVAGPGQVVGHVVGLHRGEDDPWEVVEGGGGLLDRDKVTKQAVPDTLQDLLTGLGF